MSNDAVVEIRKLVRTFEHGGVQAVNGVDLAVRRNEFVAIMGPSGCGKSTLLHLIAGLDRPTQGTIIVNGNSLAHVRDMARYRAREVGLVFQLDTLLTTLTARENVEVPMFEVALSLSDRRARAVEILSLVGLAGKEDKRPAQLSGGERQRVAIARALANEPPILLADEPTGRLDSASGRRILDLLADVRARKGLTVILVTHDADVAKRADRIVRMLDGKIADS